MGTSRRLFTLALLVSAIGVLAAVAHAEVVQSGDVRVIFHASFSPTTLPRDRPAPISVEVDGKITTTDGSQPPALKRLRIELNGAGKIEPAGLPRCSTALLQSTSSDQALERCRRALIGKGSFVALLPVAEHLQVGGRALVFNGIVQGGPGMLLHIFISNPIKLTLVIPIRISHQEGQFGTVLTTTVPKLAGGAASITQLNLNLGRRFNVDGEARSYLSAACAAPPGFPGAPFALARGVFEFSSGRSMHTTLSRNCHVRK